MAIVLALVRKKILATGNVQGVGYRVLVKQIARLFGVKGYVQNLEDGSVEIYAEAASQVMDEFIRKINIKSEKEQFFAPNISSLAAFPDSDEKFKPVEGAFRTFWVKYAEKLSEGEKEMIERAETAAIVLTGFKAETGDNFAALQGEAKAFRHETNENLIGLRENTIDFRSETRGNFTKLDVKYGSVSGTLNKINTNLEKISTAVEKLAEKFSN